MTKLHGKQESLLNKLLEDFRGDTETVMSQNDLMSEPGNHATGITLTLAGN